MERSRIPTGSLAALAFYREALGNQKTPLSLAIYHLLTMAHMAAQQVPPSGCFPFHRINSTGSDGDMLALESKTPPPKVVCSI